MNYFDDSLSEDIFAYIPQQHTNLVFTPKSVINQMLDILEAENPGCFENSKITFADPYMKSGMYIAEITKRLFVGLEKQIPDKEMRIKHILETQVYGFAASEIIYQITKQYIFGFGDNHSTIDNSNIIMLDMIPYAELCSNNEEFKLKIKEVSKMKFDIVVGNPPYQISTDGTSADKPVYHHFYNLAEKLAPKYALITPGRFLFNAGYTPKAWNQKMLSDPHLKVSYYEQVSSNVFPTTDIKGGVAILYRDETKDFGEIGTFTSFEELNSILRKVEHRDDFAPLSDIIVLQNKFNLEALYVDYPDFINIITSSGKDRRLPTSAFDKLDIFTEEKQGVDDVQILGLSKNKRLYKWINRKYLSEHGNLENYKVLVPKANGSGALGEVLSKPLIGKPLIGFTMSFMSIGSFEAENEAENALKFIKSKFARAMLGILKITQDNSRDTWRYVPLQDFTANSDIDWTQSISEIDQQLYKKYDLLKDEIKFIEENVKEMN